MGKASTATKNAWNAKAYDQVRLVVPKGQKAQMQEYAAKKGMSLNAYINSLIAADMGERLTRPTKEQEQGD
ncbi:MAG: antitoxin [Oscillospiraceae bacterium]|nr:antitoxin [Oscillospiraceae bacterium]